MARLACLISYTQWRAYNDLRSIAVLWQVSPDVTEFWDTPPPFSMFRLRTNRVRNTKYFTGSFFSLTREASRLNKYISGLLGLFRKKDTSFNINMVCLICLDVMIIWTKLIDVEIVKLFISKSDKLISMVTMCFSWIKNMMSHVQLVYRQESLNRAFLLKFGCFFVFGLWNGI